MGAVDMKREKLRISYEMLDQVNDYLLKKNNAVIEKLLEIIEKYGGPEKINKLARINGSLEVLMDKLKDKRPEYIENLEWLIEQRDTRKFISMDEYKNRVGPCSNMINESFKVTLEISSLHYFQWLITQAKHAVEHGELMPGRFIRVRFMKEQEEDGDLLGVISAMKILGASWVEALDTRGTDGSNIHLGGPETITGYFDGVGQPNKYPYKWVDEYLYYYTNYGVKQVLNLNGGTVLAGYILYKLGIDTEFKISVFMGNDNPLNVL
ncbi:unnamed protein product [marine sediment metagenome]|uniref:Uncharacterized protein n=1 Tax=marine sediment metagenome TaxID=412755 RepID=X1HXT1_9ZZZZ